MVYRLDDRLFSPPHATSRDVHTRRSAPTETSSVRLRRRVRRSPTSTRPAWKRSDRSRKTCEATASRSSSRGCASACRGTRRRRPHAHDRSRPLLPVGREQAVAATMAPSRRSEGRAAAEGLARQLPSSPVTGQIVEGKPTIIARVGDEDFELPDDHEITRRAASRGTSTWPRCTGATA